MRISDWSSDVCSSDLLREARLPYIVVLTDPTTGGVIARHRPVTLTVISNSRLKYLKARLGWRGVPTHYMPWAMNSFYEALSVHDAAVIPVERNGYTIGKTINRPAKIGRASCRERVCQYG